MCAGVATLSIESAYTLDEAHSTTAARSRNVRDRRAILAGRRGGAHHARKDSSMNTVV